MFSKNQVIAVDLLGSLSAFNHDSITNGGLFCSWMYKYDTRRWKLDIVPTLCELILLSSNITFQWLVCILFYRCLFLGWNISSSIVKSCEVGLDMIPAQQYITIKNTTFLNYACAVCNNQSVQGPDVIFWKISMICTGIPQTDWQQLTQEEGSTYEKLVSYVFGDGLLSEYEI